MITVSELISRIREVGLDAQPDTDYYQDTVDIIPAIDSAVKWLCSVLNAAKADNKDIEEALSDLEYASVYQTNIYSRVSIDDSIWTIDAVYALPVTDTVAGSSPVPQPNPKLSVKRTDLLHISSQYPCERKTVEYWGSNVGNPFAKGNQYVADINSPTVNGTLPVQFAYLNPDTYSSATPDMYDLEVRPAIPNKLVTIFYVMKHPMITASNQTIFFPYSVFNILYEKALQFISYNQGDGTNIFGVTEKDVQKLVAAIS